MTTIEFIKTEMKNQKMTAWRLAKVSGVDRAYVARLMNDKATRPGFDTILKLMRGLKINPKMIEKITL